MRFGLQLVWVALIACLATIASAEGDDVVVESVDADSAMQSFSPDLSGLDGAVEPTDETDAPVDVVPGSPEVIEDDLEADVWEAGEKLTSAEETPQVVEAEASSGTHGEEGAPSEPVTYEGTNLVVNGIELGPVGIDSEGRVGRIHTVKPGDTLWDISDAYLGTAWVWPSVWQKDNDGIENPHVIEPGDNLWISSTEIRPITNEEADAFLAEAELAVTEAPEIETIPAELDEAEAEFVDMAAMDEFESEQMDQLPVGMSDAAAMTNETGRVLRVSTRENMSFVSDVQLDASTSILDSPSDRRFLSYEDTIYIGLGEGEVEVGDEFTLFRNITEVRRPSTKKLIGYHVDVLGWAEVTEVTGDTCVAVIRVSLDGAVRGDKVMPRQQPPSDIAVKYAEDDVAGEIAFLPASRTLMGTTDYVFLDVGAVHGVEIGTDLEVYDPGVRKYDAPRAKDATTPNRIVADLVVVTVQEESSVAYVAHTRRELAVGDAVRGATRHFPDAF